MKYRDGIFATVAIALTSVALAGVVYTDVYSQTAKAEVRGVRALTEVASGDALACADTSLMSADSADLARTVRQ
ncbi:hypothetical protein JOD97_002724 [Duganella sp. 1411]|jgi:hypothetical protein|uniref:hypothetical protein n=1 Tax=Duganella sp. 1411 TaxID=2806572 RepID=UPI001AE58FE0|nr:hypothetical protein [Duganella sp. 1411]MBP1204682.1 hypothetical protein [Duganella sp. 1411]